MAQKKAPKELIDALNLDRAYELAAIIQYMGHHYEVEGMDSAAVQSIFKQIALDEMKHAEMLAERIVYLGGVPVQKPTNVKRGGGIKDMINDDLSGEYEAIERYKEHIKLCEKLGDPVTRKLLEDILADEEGHADQWETLLASGEGKKEE
ncbi:MAG TPA: ferritin [Deltaproteobacteria bacterium]|nr:ferritin [Deltaproteobacteria bacterium]